MRRMLIVLGALSAVLANAASASAVLPRVTFAGVR
jgi:hypothetical protein